MKDIYIDSKKNEHPQINIKVQRVEPSVWRKLGFYKHHYLTAELNPSCKCLLFTWENQPIAFAAILNTPRKGVPYGCAISRLVINPDFQGLGLSIKIANFCGGIIKSLSTEEKDFELYIKTAHRKMGEGLSRNKNWEGTTFDGKGRTKESTECEGKRYANRLIRKSYCKKYVGNVIDGYQDILLPIKEMRNNKNGKK